VYEREWAETLLRTALDRLAEECALAGKDELFKQLNSHLSVKSEGAVSYEEMSLRLGRPITTLRSDVARLRSRYRAILREEVGGTVADASEVDAELRHLCEVLMADQCRQKRLARRSVLSAGRGWREDSPAISGAA